MLIDARGFTFDVAVDGPAEARGVTVLLHGFPQNGTQWNGVLPRLHQAGQRTVVPDQRGYSPKARPLGVEAYDVPELAGDIVAILDALGIGQKVHLVGHDWGAIVGWHLAAHHADRFHTWTALSVPHMAAMAWAMTTDVEQQQRSAYIKLFRMPGKAEETLLENDAARLRRVFHDSGLDAAGIDRYIRPLLERGALTAALNWYRAMKRAVPNVMPVRLPTTYVWSDGDAAIGRKAAEACKRHVSGDFEFVELPGVSHWIADQEPARLADIILARIGSTA